MTGTYDTKFLAVAGVLVANFGTTATYTVLGATSFDAGTVAAGTDHTIRATAPQRWKRDLIDGTVVLEEDLWTVVAKRDGELVAGVYVDLTFTPTAPATLTYGSDAYAVVAARPYRPQDDVVAWLLHLRAN